MLFYRSTAAPFLSESSSFALCTLVYRLFVVPVSFAEVLWATHTKEMSLTLIVEVFQTILVQLAGIAVDCIADSYEQSD